MIDKNFESRIMNEINQKELKPLPKYLFVIRDILVWAFFLLLFGTASFLFFLLISLFIVLYNENSLNSSFFDNLSNSLLFMPVSLVSGLLIVFVILVILLKNTGNLYKYTGLSLFSLNFILLIIVGNSLYLLSGDALNKTEFIKHTKKEFIQQRWDKPKEGFFIGQIVNINKDTKGGTKLIIKLKDGSLINLEIDETYLKNSGLKLNDSVRLFTAPIIDNHGLNGRPHGRQGSGNTDVDLLPSIKELKPF